MFADFVATMEGSAFSCSCIIGYGSSPSRCGPPTHVSGQARDLPVPEQRASVHARVFDHAELRALAKARPAVLPSTLSTVSALGSFYLRGSIPGLHSPRPTLRPQPHGWTRTAWGQCGSLFLHCSGLSPPTLCRSPGAPATILTQGGVPRPLVESKSMLAKVSSLRLFEPNQKLIGVTAY